VALRIPWIVHRGDKVLNVGTVKWCDNNLVGFRLALEYLDASMLSPPRNNPRSAWAPATTIVACFSKRWKKRSSRGISA
jgi:hypothetical protein